MKILLTGANGMVGKNITELANQYNHHFLTPSSSELNLLDNIAINKYLTIHQPEMIIHAAGIVGGIHLKKESPVRFLTDNMYMGINILTSARTCNVKQFLNISSSCIYPQGISTPLSEDLIFTGELESANEGYGLAKIAATRLCEYINQEEPDLSYKTIIPCNLYGRYDKFSEYNSHMIPAVIKKIIMAKEANISEIDIWGDGEARREFMYAGDLAEFIFYAIEHFDRMPQNLNVGLGTDFTINEYYHSIADIVGFSGKFKHDLSKPVGIKKRLIDNRQLQSFGWSPKTELTSGLKKTIQFFLNEQHLSKQ